MFAIAIEYLMGWSMAAADGARKERAEWPPHPDRLFMALAAGWFETDGGGAEEQALRWLETLPPPSLACSDAQPRTVVTHYVPINDAGLSAASVVDRLLASANLDFDKLRPAGLGQLPESRLRKARSFPVAVPLRSVVHFVWSVPLDPVHRAALQSLCDKLSCLGHSASLARAWIDEAPPPPNWTPVDGAASMRLRISGAGRLDALNRRLDREALQAYADMEAAIAKATGKARKVLQAQRDERFAQPPLALRPEPGLWQGYERLLPVAQGPAVAHGAFDARMLVLSIQGQRLSLPSTLLLTGALRGALLRHCDSQLPEWVTGHGPDGRPSRSAHLAMLPVAFVAGPHADGRVLGLALALPRGVPPHEAAQALAPLLWDEAGAPREIRLYDGRALDCLASLDQRERPPATLDPQSWTAAARIWATVTPIALDRHLDGRDAWRRATAVVADACEYAGLPRPADVLLDPHSAHAGVPPASAFPPLTRKRDGGRLAHTHAVLRFDRPVAGPVLLGAGRFRGYGLCRPLPRGQGSGHD